MFTSFFRTAAMIAFATMAPAAFAQEIGRAIDPMPAPSQGFSPAVPQTYTAPNTATTLSPTQLPLSAPALNVTIPPPSARVDEPAHADAPRCWCHVVNPGNSIVERTKCGPECCHGDSTDDGC
jgi:hypothetical protein